MLLTEEAYNQLQKDFSRRWNRYVLDINHYESITRQKEFVYKLLLIDAYRYQSTKLLVGMKLNDITPLIMLRAKSMSFTDEHIQEIIEPIRQYDDFKIALSYVQRYFVYNHGDDKLQNYLDYVSTLKMRELKPQTYAYRDEDTVEEETE